MNEIKNHLVNRRRLLQLGVAGAAMTVAPRWLGARADMIDDTHFTKSGGTVQRPKKDPPYRIGFSNGFSGNSWRAMCIASLEAEVANQPDVAELIIVDGIQKVRPGGEVTAVAAGTPVGG